MNNKYYQKTHKEKRSFQLKLAGACVFFLLFITSVCYFLGFYYLPIIFLWLILSIVAPFFDIPVLIKSEKLKYYSSLLLAEKEKNNIIVIHGGTLFDYYFLFDQNSSGNKRRKFILQQYLEGILNLIKDHDQVSTKNLSIVGTTYIIAEKTGKKLGFTPKKPDFVQTIILVVNYPNLLVTKSFANRKLSFPKLSKIRTFNTTLEKLKANKIYMENLNEKLKSSLV